MSSGSGPRSRSYRMTKRADTIEETRQKIIEAAVMLHGTVGPAATTVMGIAEQADVTRASVYRHFPDEAALFQACSTHWLAQQSPPDPDLWIVPADPLQRLRVGLSDLYRFFRGGESMLTRIYTDKDSLPEPHRTGLDARHAAFCELLQSGFPRMAKRGKRLHAVISHAVEFWTWRSLCIENGLADDEAVELMVQFVASVVRDGGTS